MATEDEKVLGEIHDSLRRLEKAVREGGQSPSGSRTPRSTEQFPKVELEIMRKIQEHRTACSASMKEVIGEKVEPLLAKMKEIEVRVDEINKELGGRINGVRDEATKTATGTVVTLTDKVDNINDSLFGTRGDAGLEDSVRDHQGWIDRYEEKKAKTAASSKFKLSTLLQIAGILVAIALGVIGIVLR